MLLESWRVPDASRLYPRLTSSVAPGAHGDLYLVHWGVACSFLVVKGVNPCVLAASALYSQKGYIAIVVQPPKYSKLVVGTFLIQTQITCSISEYFTNGLIFRSRLILDCWFHINL